jgi:uncharacterized MAPEG superfamily protein
MTTTLTALLGFAAWFVFLSIVLGFYRIGLVMAGQKAPNTFAVDGRDVPPLGQRLTRARDNCYETLPLFAALALVAHLSGRAQVTDPLAMWVLYARIGQSLTHITSTSVPFVLVRANLFFAQMLIYAWWCLRLFG